MSSSSCSSQPVARNYSRPLPQLPPSHHLDQAAHSPATSASEEGEAFDEILDLGRFLDMDDLRCGGDGLTWRKPLSAPHANFSFPQVLHFSRIPLPGARRTSITSSRRESRTSVLFANPRPQSYSFSAPSSPAVDRTAAFERPSHPEPAAEAPNSPLQSFFLGRRPSVGLEQDIRYAWEMREQKEAGEAAETEQRRWSSAMVLEPGEWETKGDQVWFEVMGVAL
ncbi:hypothetical protein BCR35DRAFT_309950 [Leucosporidium creatinivorum]|uniref:Uncharacterized protein n=1 Tax=Leucosporidium creatinivorum TaxID=106004 RepID=A0A1Y2D9N8_9BASI|nr:hypothetical protein BCR35DRAFT_309950 [Leucosporidium creatinivorum]